MNRQNKVFFAFLLWALLIACGFAACTKFVIMMRADMVRFERESYFESLLDQPVSCEECHSESWENMVTLEK